MLVKVKVPTTNNVCSLKLARDLVFECLSPFLSIVVSSLLIHYDMDVKFLINQSMRAMRETLNQLELNTHLHP